MVKFLENFPCYSFFSYRNHLIEYLEPNFYIFIPVGQTSTDHHYKKNRAPLIKRSLCVNDNEENCYPARSFVG